MARGVKLLTAKLSKMQNIALCWISGAFCTTPIPLLEFFTGIAPVQVKLDFQLQNFLAWVSTVPRTHPLCHLALTILIYSTHALHCRHCTRPKSKNIHLLHALIKDFPPFALSFPLLCIGSCIIDIFANWIIKDIPSHPPKSSDLFPNWLIGWCRDTAGAISKTGMVIGTDASYGTHHVGTAAFVVQWNNSTI